MYDVVKHIISPVQLPPQWPDSATWNHGSSTLALLVHSKASALDIPIQLCFNFSVSPPVCEVTSPVPGALGEDAITALQSAVQASLGEQ